MCMSADEITVGNGSHAMPPASSLPLSHTLKVWIRTHHTHAHAYTCLCFLYIFSIEENWGLRKTKTCTSHLDCSTILLLDFFDATKSSERARLKNHRTPPVDFEREIKIRFYWKMHLWQITLNFPSLDWKFFLWGSFIDFILYLKYN